MTVYKLVRVQFDLWGFRGQVESYIQDYIRKTLSRAHRQAWVWQDEWTGLTMADIREMERELQESLAEKVKLEPIDK